MFRIKLSEGIKASRVLCMVEEGEKKRYTGSCAFRNSLLIFLCCVRVERASNECEQKLDTQEAFYYYWDADDDHERRERGA